MCIFGFRPRFRCGTGKTVSMSELEKAATEPSSTDFCWFALDAACSADCLTSQTVGVRNVNLPCSASRIIGGRPRRRFSRGLPSDDVLISVGGGWSEMTEGEGGAAAAAGREHGCCCWCCWCFGENTEEDAHQGALVLAKLDLLLGSGGSLPWIGGNHATSSTSSSNAEQGVCGRGETEDDLDTGDIGADSSSEGGDGVGGRSKRIEGGEHGWFSRTDIDGNLVSMKV